MRTLLRRSLHALSLLGGLTFAFSSWGAPTSIYGENGSTWSGFIENLLNLITDSISLLFIIATVIFLWGIIKYIKPGDSKENVSEGRTYIVYGIITLFVMYSIWTFAYILSDTFFGSPSPNLWPF